MEIIKLLIQVAWADDQVTPEELAHITEFATKAGMSPEQLGILRQYLDASLPPPIPDFAFLKSHKEDVLLSVMQLIASDDIEDSEQEIMAEIEIMLS